MSKPVAFRPVPPELVIYGRSVSDDDLCAWCCGLLYMPGEASLCQLHDGPQWPGTSSPDGYVICCVAFRAAS